VLEGDLGDFSLPDVLRLLSFTGKTGRLALSDDQRTGDIDLISGRVRHARLGADPLALSRLLVRCGLVDAGTLEEALGRAGPDDREILPALLAAGRLDDAALAVPLREHVIDVVVALGRWRVGSFRFDAAPALDLTDAATPGGVASAAAPAVGGFSLPVDELLAEVDRRLEAHAILDRAVGAAYDPAHPAEGAASTLAVGLRPPPMPRRRQAAHVARSSPGACSPGPRPPPVGLTDPPRARGPHRRPPLRAPPPSSRRPARRSRAQPPQQPSPPRRHPRHPLPCPRPRRCERRPRAARVSSSRTRRSTHSSSTG